jgi:hypothetical protein
MGNAHENHRNGSRLTLRASMKGLVKGLKMKPKKTYALALLLGTTLILTSLAKAQTATPSVPSIGSEVVQLDHSSLHEYLRALGYRTRGGIDRSKTDSQDERFHSFPHFSSSFSVGGVTYPFTMVGHPPKTGQPARLRSVIVPLRMKFAGFGKNGNISITFNPSDAVTNILNSPMYQDASFPNGVGQFVDQMQRATFWNKMDDGHHWHVRMAQPRVMRTISIEVTPETGSLSKDQNGNYFGNVKIDFMDAEALTIMQVADLEPDEVAIFVTDNVTAQALGYHSAAAVDKDDGSQTLSTYIYTSWLDPALVDPLFADVSTLNHELAEWMNDPYINNRVPAWQYPPPTDPRAVCAHNPFLEVGDPQGNGATFDDFPTIVVTVGAVPYHLQQLVMLPWFADEVPSSGENGWYTFPDPTSLTVPAVYCK